MKPMNRNASIRLHLPWKQTSTPSVRKFSARTALRDAKSTLTSADVDLWKAYSNALQGKYFGGINTKDHAFFTAPMSRVGIPAGTGVDQAITNLGIYQCADPLLDLSSPMFAAGEGSYIERQMRLAFHP